MRKAKVYFLNGLTVSFVGLVLRFAAMAYTVYVSGKLGAEGMGLLGLLGPYAGFNAGFLRSEPDLHPALRRRSGAGKLQRNPKKSEGLYTLQPVFRAFCGGIALFPFGLSRKFRVKGSANGGLFAGAVPGASGIRPDRLLLRLHERLPTGLQGVLGFDF